MLQIRFSHNWNNKLGNKVFTTIRKWDAEKADYYFGNKGKTFTVLLNDKVFGTAKLFDVAIGNINDLPEVLLLLDTGLTRQEEIIELFKKFGVKDKVIILLFERAYPDKFETGLGLDV